MLNVLARLVVDDAVLAVLAVYAVYAVLAVV